MGLEKESKGDRVMAKGEPAVMAVGNVEVQRRGSVRAGSTVIWKAPLRRVWGLMREDVTVTFQAPA